MHPHTLYTRLQPQHTSHLCLCLTPSRLYLTLMPCAPLTLFTRYENTERRKDKVEAKGLRYMGMGVSGGEEGARRGE